MKKLSAKTGKTSKTPQKRNGLSLRSFMQLPYKIELSPLSKTEGAGFMATIPLLKGCQSDGPTPDEAIRNLREAQKAWIASALKHNDPIPLPQ